MILTISLGLAGAWRTVETEHFRLHYPVEATEWALEAASQLEPIRERVSQEVGTNFERVVDIVVQDPFTRANGYAIPRARSPRMGIFASPPYADGILGHYRSWEEDLITHEDAHLVHLMIPSRNPAGRTLVQWALNSGPLARKTPRWVAEGYATVVEGRLTGFGRPNSDGRATVLRVMARSGAMPLYSQLDGSDRWMGGSFAYLVGSAFLEWLEVEYGEGKQRELWMAMSARKTRSFDEAFTHVFGEAPQPLYERFVAELVHDALELEQARPALQDTLFQDTPWSTGPVALSPDGTRLAYVKRHKWQVDRLVVVPFEDDGEARKAWVDAQTERLEKDPLDPAGVEPETWPREPLEQSIRWDRSPSDPRWMPDGQGILYTSFLKAGEFEWVPDLVIWDLEQGQRVLTHGAAVRDADPHPTEGWAVAVRQRWSLSQLVRVDLHTGEWTAITEPTVEVVHDSPRISPEGDRIAYVANAGQGWRLIVRTIATGEEWELPTPERSLISHPAWGDEGLYATVGTGGFMEVWHFPEEGGWTVCTRTHGGAMAPEPDGSGGLFFLSMDPNGLDIHHVEQPGDFTEEAWVGRYVVRPPPPAPVPLPERRAVESRGYRGVPGPSLIGGAQLGPKVSGGELGLRLGDVAGQWEAALIWGDGYTGGWGAQAGWYRLPVEVHGAGWALDRDMGGALYLQKGLWWNSGSATAKAGWVQSEDHQSAFALADADHHLWMGRWNLGGEASVATWSQDGQVRASAGLDGGWGPIGLYGKAGWGRSDSLMGLGGSPTIRLPELARPNTILAPAFAPLAAVGTEHRMWEAGLGSPFGLTMGYERHVMSGASFLDEKQGISAVTVGLEQSGPRQPVFRVSRTEVAVGVGCVLENPEEGYVGCGQWESWTGWTSVVFLL